MQSTGYFAAIYRFGLLICGPKNRVLDIKSGHDFCRYRNSVQVIYFQINGAMREEIEKRYRIQEGYHRYATRASTESSHKTLCRNIAIDF